MPTMPPPPDIPEGLEHLLALFIAEMATDCATLTALVTDFSADAAPDVAEHAHAMRGKAGLFGENLLYELLTEIENAALAGNGALLPGLVARVVERVAQLEVYGREMAAEQA